MTGPSTARTAAAAVAGLLLVAGCGSSQQAPATSAPSASATSTPSATPTPSKTPSPSKTASASAHVRAPHALSVPIAKVLVVIEENHSLDQMRAGMPYLAHLSETYGYATDWRALTHPSEPNYLAIAGGSTFGVTDDASPAINAGKVGRAESVFDQALHAGRTAGTYAQSMPVPCDTDSRPQGAGRAYAVRHNPWVYFEAGRAGCRAHDRDTATFAAAARADALPNVGFLIPDLDHDAHDGTLAEADAYLQQQLGPVLASPDFRTGRLAVVVTADEDDKHSGNRVLTSVLSTRLHHKVVATPLDHYSLTRFIDEVLGQPPLGQAKHAPDMRAAFGL